MRYKNLVINGFRGIQKSRIENLTRVNVFLGKNNCGKSTVLETLFLLTGINNPHLVLNIDTFRELFHTEEDDFRFVFHNLDYNVPIEILAEYPDEGYRSLKITPNNSPTYNEVQLKKSDASSNSTEVSPTSANVNGLTLKGEIKKRHQGKTTTSSTINLTRDKATQTKFEFKPDPKFHMDFNGIFQHSRYTAGSEINKRLETLLITKNKQRLIDALKMIDSKINDIILGQNNMIYIDIGADRYIPSNLMGDGLNKLLHIYLNLETVKGGVLLIDEIDNGLHFSALRNLWKVILKVSAENNTQIFCTTHSQETIETLIALLKEEDYSQYQQEVHFYTLVKTDTGILESLMYDYENAEFSIEKELEIRGEF